MRKLSTGISNYEKIIRENLIYIDKTKFIEKIENIVDSAIMFLRPRKFGKTLFTSTLENYYDKKKKDQFEDLFANTYIGKNPTQRKNSYNIMKFNFSGIDTSTVENTLQGFKNEVLTSIDFFAKKYQMDFYVNYNLDAEENLNNIIKAFELQKPLEQIYVIIDEYDHFANELLGFKTQEFCELMSKNGKVRKWYEILKKGTESVIDKIFMTGVSPITLDSTTSGFNIAKDITQNINFSDMLGFSKKDVEYIMTELEISPEKQKELLPIIKINYDGYVFSDNIKNDNIEEYKMYNPNMTQYFLSNYIETMEIPKKFVDTNIISDYGKIEAMMNLCESMGKIELLERIVAGEPIEAELTEKFNNEIVFGERELISLLYYLGYITITKKGYSQCEFKAPNEVIKDIINFKLS